MQRNRSVWPGHPVGHVAAVRAAHRGGARLVDVGRAPRRVRDRHQIGVRRPAPLPPAAWMSPGRSRSRARGRAAALRSRAPPQPRVPPPRPRVPASPAVRRGSRAAAARSPARAPAAASQPRTARRRPPSRRLVSVPGVRGRPPARAITAGCVAVRASIRTGVAASRSGRRAYARDRPDRPDRGVAACVGRHAPYAVRPPSVCQPHPEYRTMPRPRRRRTTTPIHPGTTAVSPATGRPSGATGRPSPSRHVEQPQRRTRGASSYELSPRPARQAIRRPSGENAGSAKTRTAHSRARDARRSATSIADQLRGRGNPGSSSTAQPVTTVRPSGVPRRTARPERVPAPRCQVTGLDLSHVRSAFHRERQQPQSAAPRS